MCVCVATISKYYKSLLYVSMNLCLWFYIYTFVYLYWLFIYEFTSMHLSTRVIYAFMYISTYVSITYVSM